MKKGFFKKALVALAVGVGLILALWLARAPILRGVARAWIIHQPTEKADAVYVLGGGLQYRTFEAVRLYQQGIVPKILLSHSKPSPTDELGLTKPEPILMREVLLKKGIPEQAIQFIGTNVTSTYEETLALRDWARQSQARRVIICTDFFHTRRCRWIFNRTIPGGSVELRFTAISPQDPYTPDNWWQREAGLITFNNEVVKFLFYLAKY
jgi:uncharacterized SAM-binding protein YcdF (DUF218 family)